MYFVGWIGDDSQAAAGKAIIKEILQKAAVLTISLGTLLIVLIYFGRVQLIGLFVRDASVIEPGSHLVAYQLIMEPIIGIYYLSKNFLQAGGNAAGASVASAHNIL